MDESENMGWILHLFMLTILLAFVVWFTFLSLHIFWDRQVYRWSALGGYIICIVFGAFFSMRSNQEIRDRLVFGGYTLIAIIVLVWFLSMLGTRYGWWSSLQITAPL